MDTRIEIINPNNKLIKVILAIDDCVGISIPYPIAVKMAHVSKELKLYLEQLLMEKDQTD